MGPGFDRSPVETLDLHQPKAHHTGPRKGPYYRRRGSSTGSRGTSTCFVVVLSPSVSALSWSLRHTESGVRVHETPYTGTEVLTVSPPQSLGVSPELESDPRCTYLRSLWGRRPHDPARTCANTRSHTRARTRHTRERPQTCVPGSVETRVHPDF